MMEAASKDKRLDETDPSVEIWTCEFRFKTVDGGYRDVSDRAILLRNANRRCVRVIGSMLSSSRTGRSTDHGWCSEMARKEVSVTATVKTGRSQRVK